jgi:UDPglucose 6-dehydrogenase
MVEHVYVAGAGCAGLVTAACYANAGKMVSIYERDAARRKILSSMKAPFSEPNLSELLLNVMEQGHLRVVGDPVSAARASDLSVVAVGTPSKIDDSVDLSMVLAACNDIAQGLRKSSRYHLVAIRSTVFPGTTNVLSERLERTSGKRAGHDFGLVVYPEFLRTGSAIDDMLHPDRVVIGAFDDHSGNALQQFLAEFYDGNPPCILRVTPTTAEIIKYASNAFLGTKVAFMNEIANLCDRFEDVDVRQVAEAMGYDPRIGRELPFAGLGFGGPCLPKDLRALAAGARRNGVRLRIAEAALRSNELQNRAVLRMARKLVGGTLKNKRAAVLGLAFKPGTSDMREAPSVDLIRALLDARMNVIAYDPVAMGNAAAYFGKRVEYAKGIRDCLAGAHCCFIVTEWNEFRTIPSDTFLDAMAKPVIIDGRRALDPSRLDPRITYGAIGLGKRGER